MKKIIFSLLTIWQLNLFYAHKANAVAGGLAAPTVVATLAGGACVAVGLLAIEDGYFRVMDPRNGATEVIAGIVEIIGGVLLLDTNTNAYSFSPLEESEETVRRFGLDSIDEIRLYNFNLPEINQASEIMMTQTIALNREIPIQEAAKMFTDAADQVELSHQARLVFAKVLKKSFANR